MRLQLRVNELLVELADPYGLNGTVTNVAAGGVRDKSMAQAVGGGQVYVATHASIDT